LLLLLTIQLTLQGFFRQKASLPNKSPPPQPTIHNDRKVIMMLFDALREDFVEWPEESKKHLRLTPDKHQDFFKGDKVTLFKDLYHEHPERTVLLPMESAMPTVTAVRIKSILNGGLSTFFETTNEFMTTAVIEDNILYQAKNRVGGERNKVVFIGDDIWSPMYGDYFDSIEEFNSLNTRDLETVDNNVQQRIFNKLTGDNDFKLMVTHVLGVDSAGHSYNS
jgi:predicted AlkP superfamily pyrophosphatase or phosphodiesterase